MADVRVFRSFKIGSFLFALIFARSFRSGEGARRFLSRRIATAAWFSVSISFILSVTSLSAITPVHSSVCDWVLQHFGRVSAEEQILNRNSEKLGFEIGVSEKTVLATKMPPSPQQDVPESHKEKAEARFSFQWRANPNSERSSPVIVEFHVDGASRIFTASPRDIRFDKDLLVAVLKHLYQFAPLGQRFELIIQDPDLVAKFNYVLYEARSAELVQADEPHESTGTLIFPKSDRFSDKRSDLVTLSLNPLSDSYFPYFSYSAAEEYLRDVKKREIFPALKQVLSETAFGKLLAQTGRWEVRVSPESDFNGTDDWVTPPHFHYVVQLTKIFND